MKKQGPAIYLETDGGPLITVVLVDAEGREHRRPAITPAEDLLSVLAVDYTEYRSAISELRATHPLFEERVDVSVLDYRDLIRRVLALPAMMKDHDPIAWFATTARLNYMVQQLPVMDNGSASFLLDSGMRLIEIAEEPIRTQVRLRNIFEVAFDGMERATQRERFEKLAGTYPDVLDRYFFCRWMETTDGTVPLGNRLEYTLQSIYDLRMLELTLYFKQEEQRIARCEYCWEYFIPKTKKQTCYCDRQFGKKTCKQLGPNLKRNLGPEQDGALRLFELLYSRMTARRDRYENAPPDKRDHLIGLSDLEFDEWNREARKTRMDYLQKKISAEEFLHSIDLFGELVGCEITEQKLVELSRWQKSVAADIDFDPAWIEPIQRFELSAENTQCRIVSREEQIREAQKGHQSLRDKYDKES